MKKKDNLNIHGHLEVIKVYSDGREEIHWSEKNVITSGMGVGLAYLFARLAPASSNILDYQIRYFQLGVSGSSNYGTSTYELTSAIPVSYLSASPDLIFQSHTQLKNGAPVANQPFIYISPANVYKASPTTVRFHLIIPQNCLNNVGVPINEVGLFMKNPTGQNPFQSILVAYKYFSSVFKTDDYALLFRWTINF